MKTYSNIAIKTNNQIEKLAAMAFLSSKTGAKINQSVLEHTVNNQYVTEFPFVAITDNGLTGVNENLPNFENYVVVDFCDINKVDEILEKENSPKLVFGKKYIHKNGDFIIPLRTHLDEVVFAGLFNDPFRLYSDGPRTEENAIEYLKQEGFVLEE